MYLISVPLVRYTKEVVWFWWISKKGNWKCYKYHLCNKCTYGSLRFGCDVTAVLDVAFNIRNYAIYNATSNKHVNLVASFHPTSAQAIGHWIANPFPLRPRSVRRRGSKKPLVSPCNEYLDPEHTNSPSVTTNDLDWDLKNAFISEKHCNS